MLSAIKGFHCILYTFNIIVGLNIPYSFVPSEEAMSFLVERIMQISTKEPQNAPSPTRDMIDGVEDTDGLVTLVNSQSQVTNGHVPKSTEREKSDCCV